MDARTHTAARAGRSRSLAALMTISAMFLTAAPTVASADDVGDMLAGPALAKTLRDGGNVIYVRHALTEKDYADQDGRAEIGHCNTQRVLGEKGFNQAREIGAAIKSQDIPVGQVVASQYCRAFKTAALAFGHYTKDAALNFAQSDADGEYNDAMKKQMKDNITPLLSHKPAAGTNTVLVGHDDPFEMATGIYPKPSGVVYVVKPEGNGHFNVLGKIAPDDWQTLGAPPNMQNDR